MSNSSCHHFVSNLSHGKSPCDRIGGTVKRLVTRASLQATTEGQILTAEQMFHWAEKHITGIKFVFITAEEVLQNSIVFNLEKRFNEAKSIAGTRSHHSLPLSLLLMCRIISSDNELTTICIGTPATPNEEPPPPPPGPSITK